MKFELEMKIDNAAFKPQPGPEIARILRELAKKVERDDPAPDSVERSLFDVNGNRIGWAAYTSTAAEEAETADADE